MKQRRRSLCVTAHPKMCLQISRFVYTLHTQCAGTNIGCAYVLGLCITEVRLCTIRNYIDVRHDCTYVYNNTRYFKKHCVLHNTQSKKIYYTTGETGSTKGLFAIYYGFILFISFLFELFYMIPIFHCIQLLTFSTVQNNTKMFKMFYCILPHFQ